MSWSVLRIALNKSYVQFQSKHISVVQFTTNPISNTEQSDTALNNYCLSSTVIMTHIKNNGSGLVLCQII